MPQLFCKILGFFLQEWTANWDIPGLNLAEPFRERFVQIWKSRLFHLLLLVFVQSSVKGTNNVVLLLHNGRDSRLWQRRVKTSSNNSVFLPIKNCFNQFIFLFQGQNSSLLCLLFLGPRQLWCRSSITGSGPAFSCCTLKACHRNIGYCTQWQERNSTGMVKAHGFLHHKII